MPIVSKFYGITIKMFFIAREHQPPHFHAVYGEFNGYFEISTLEMLEGDLPRRAEKLVKEWGAKYQEDLQRMWDTQEFIQLPGLE